MNQKLNDLQKDGMKIKFRLDGKTMNGKKPVIEMEELGLNDYGYDYRFYLQDGKTVGYLKRDNFGYCELYYGETPCIAYANNEVMSYGDTPNSIKDSLNLEFEYTYHKC